MSTRSEASRKAWISRKRQAAARAQAGLEARLAGARETLGSAHDPQGTAALIGRIDAIATAARQRS